MAWYMCFPAAPACKPKLRVHVTIERRLFVDILKVGAGRMLLAAAKSVLTITIVTRLLAGFGNGGAGRLRHRRATGIHAVVAGLRGRRRIGADGRDGDRCGPGGAGTSHRMDVAARSCRSRWSFGFFGDAGRVLSGYLWINMFTERCRRARCEPSLISRPPHRCTRFVGLLGHRHVFFASQGAAKVIGPVLAQTARLVFIGIGGWWLTSHNAEP